ncbi:hypothetical protein QW180_27395 [Vibrio sinaloensis]|nr:hypothetical protein [Vibrio sinaloensis]
MALYYANQNGDLTLFRAMRSNNDRNQFSAPDKASLMINQTRVDGSNDFYFLDGSFRLLATRNEGNNEFDPRVRPWFINADLDGEIRLTEPYFYFLKTNGVTFFLAVLPMVTPSLGLIFTLDSLSEQIGQLGYSEKQQIGVV